MKNESLTIFLSQLAVKVLEDDPRYWEVMSSALSVGWLDIVVKMLWLHGSYQLDQLSNRELENGLVEAVAVLISKMPCLCREYTNGKLGELFKSKPDFIKVKFAIQYMRRAIQKLLGCTEENPEEGKGCCLIVLFSYLYFG
ncbi:hypothetical protein HN51_069857 [Arachis hypogaea]